MDGWMDGWMGWDGMGWTDGWMDGWCWPDLAHTWLTGEKRQPKEIHYGLSFHLGLTEI